MTRIVLDTNIYISALQFGGVPRQVIDLVLDGECQGFVSAAIRDETFGILVTKFGWDELEASDRLAWLMQSFQMVSPTAAISGVIVDDADHRILECAVAATACVIVSGDKHLLDLGSYANVRIVTARQFLELMRR